MWSMGEKSWRAYLISFLSVSMTSEITYEVSGGGGGGRCLFTLP